jgi:hypothetical protein
VSLVEPLNLAVSTHVKRSSKGEYKRAFEVLVALLNTRGLRISSLVVDPEGALVAAAGAIPFVSREVANVRGHVAKAERLIQQLKEGVRAVLSSLGYPLPRRLLPHLLTFITGRRNSMFAKGGGTEVPARELFLGRKIDYKKELSLGFGDYVQVYRRPRGPKNTMAARAEDALAMYPTGGESGAWMFFVMRTAKLVSRSRWVQQPLSEDMRERINNMALFDGMVNELPPVYVDVGEIDEAIPPDELVVLDPIQIEVGPGITEGEEVQMHQTPNDVVPQVHFRDDLNQANNEFNRDLNVGASAEDAPEVVPVAEDAPVQVVGQPPLDPMQKVTRRGRAYLAKVSKTIVKGGRINQREAIKRYDKRAFDSMFEQLSVLDQKGTFVPVDPKTLSKQEFKRIIRSFMFL